MDPASAITALGAVVTAVASTGAFRYVRNLADDADYARRALDGEKHSRGVIEVVDENEDRSKQNKEALVEHDLRTDGGETDA